MGSEQLLCPHYLEDLSIKSFIKEGADDGKRPLWLDRIKVACTENPVNLPAH